MCCDSSGLTAVTVKESEKSKLGISEAMESM